MSWMRLAAALALSTGLLAACGGGDDDSSAPDAEAAAGDVVKADDFTFNAPDGWEQNDGSALPSMNFLALAVDPQDTADGFGDNVNIIEDQTITRLDDVDDLGEAVEKVLTGVAKDVELGEPTSVDGEDAATVSATFTQGDVTYDTIQYAVAHDDKGFVVTFSYSEDRPDAEKREIAESVMASWKWAA